MQTIGLIAAMTLERDALLRNVNGLKRVKLGSFDAKIFKLFGQTCWLVTSGMGVRRASEAARMLVESSAPRCLISFGIAGAVESDVQIGDVVTAEAVCRLDQGVAGPLLRLAAWPAAARCAASQALLARGARLWTGTAVTTGGGKGMEGRLEKMMHPILEMETAGIAQVAAEKCIPLYSIRAISDGPDAPIPFDLGELVDEDANLQAVRLWRTILRHPGIVFKAGRLIQNSRIAANNAAAALMAAIRAATL